MEMNKSLPTLSCVLLAFLAAGAVVAFAPAPAQAQAGPYQYFAVTPCRVFDTRTSGAQTNGQPLPNPGPHDFRIQGNCGIPNGAKAVTINVTVVSPTQQGDLRLFPVGAPTVDVSTLNYPPNEPALANGAIVPLGAVSLSTDKDLRTVIGMVTSGTIHLLVDVTGYFM
jgi:hypothetical protein